MNKNMAWQPMKEETSVDEKIWTVDENEFEDAVEWAAFDKCWNAT